MNKENYLTTGQLAKRTGITVRTLRYYDQIGLLSPEGHHTGSTRSYNMKDLERLQRIQMLKYLGLSLQKIKAILDAESLSNLDIRHSLQAQLDVLQRKIAHTEHVVHAIRDAMQMSTYGSNWDHLADVIQTVQSEKNWGEQYRTANRLQTRIHLYDKYSTNPQGWHRWIFEQLEVQPEAHILELGCGDGTFWLRNAERIPSNWRITLTDMSSGMVEEARCRLGNNHSQFKFLSVDAQQIPFHDEQFDMVIANNMLYHVLDIPRAIREMHRVLKQGGIVCTSTMSLQHLQEVEHLGVSFDPDLHVLDDAIKRFHLGNGGDLLSSCFSDLRLLRYDDRLLIDEAEPLIEYMISTPMNARERLVGAAIDKFRAHINRLLQQNGVLEMTKENGIFLGRK
ncbi:MerR family transcriptional regulator [Paenibacillus polymyxa]|uniref:MerR family transcriptional regulator n=1 Tax=Paenibacillus polymyxa TaxID=1406 RepID=UPI0020246591|nr:methyltransferase domain-containing protein [Paenibacillus polymyxa]WDZ55258.1 methyltransferase domain-containing protein [Paenibacillus polymyxa]